VHTSVPVKNIKEYIAFAKANPGALNFATPGKGGSLHMPGVLLDYMAKINVTYVHYSRSAQRLTDTVAGFTQVMVGADNLLPHFKSGRLRPLGVTTLKRSPLLPDLPAIAETLPGYDYSGWTGIVAPAKVETALLAKINKIWTEAMRDNISQEKVAAEGASVVANSSQEFAKFIATEVAKWAAVVKATGLTMGNNE
jgi:tripartite-type tricarboxylate transporter receptor subunit TctC